MYAEITHTTSRLIALSSKNRRIGEDHQVAKYSNQEIEQVIQLRYEGFSYTKISKMVDIPRSTCHAICTGKMRAIVPDHWRRMYE